ncbi:hypothetical protein OV320_5301 [Actinobacteria bacterium OV320]|nr:hypothetical protein OV320_5301 [Actinobacteria bacterium OV320]
MPTPDEPGKPHERPVLEPIRVLRPRNTDALAELFREMAELTQDPDAYEAIPLRPEAAGDEEAHTDPGPGPQRAHPAAAGGGGGRGGEGGPPATGPPPHGDDGHGHVHGDDHADAARRPGLGE